MMPDVIALARSAPVRQLVFASGVVFTCLALGSLLMLRGRMRLIVLVTIVLLFCAVFAWWSSSVNV